MIIDTNGEVLMPEHFGFCEGVVAADDLMRHTLTVSRNLGIHKVYGYHDIVHNTSVREEHEAGGAEFISSPELAPDQSIVVASAHGTSPSVMHRFNQKGCLVLDAVCPLVTHTHKEAQAARRDGEHVIYVIKGKPGDSGVKLHDEVAGTIGHLDYVINETRLHLDQVDRTYAELTDDVDEIADGLRGCGGKFRIITQTTLNADDCFAMRDELSRAIISRVPYSQVKVSRRGDVCSAVRDRQEGVRVLFRGLEQEKKKSALLVVTDPNSKNGRGYYDLAQQMATRAGADNTMEVLAVTAADELDALEPIIRGRRIGVTASASTPDRDIVGVLSRLGVDDATLEFKRPRFHLYHGDGTRLDDPNSIERIIRHWQQAA